MKTHYHETVRRVGVSIVETLALFDQKRNTSIKIVDSKQEESSNKQPDVVTKFNRKKTFMN